MVKAKDLIGRSGAAGFSPAPVIPLKPVQLETSESKPAAKATAAAAKSAQAQGGGGKAPVTRRPKV